MVPMPMTVGQDSQHTECGRPVMLLRASYSSDTPGKLTGVLLADVDRIISGVMPGPYRASFAAVSTLIFPPARQLLVCPGFPKIPYIP